jgi:hypothetical protein
MALKYDADERVCAETALKLVLELCQGSKSTWDIATGLKHSDHLLLKRRGIIGPKLDKLFHVTCQGSKEDLNKMLNILHRVEEFERLAPTGASGAETVCTAASGAEASVIAFEPEPAADASYSRITVSRNGVRICFRDGTVKYYYGLGARNTAGATVTFGPIPELTGPNAPKPSAALVAKYGRPAKHVAVIGFSGGTINM